MKILALILARGGSKRLPGKNLLPLGGKPLIQWSIDTAKGLSQICDVLVSTDDHSIASVARECGALVPWLRPAHLATDESSSVDSALHAVDWYESERGFIDGVLLLQPTSPFRTEEMMKRGIELFQINPSIPVVGVVSARTHPYWVFKVANEKLVPFVKGVDFTKRSQDLPIMYQISGAFYLISPVTLRKNRSFISDSKVIPIMAESEMEAIDIDTPLDYELAKIIAEMRNVTKSAL